MHRFYGLITLHLMVLAAAQPAACQQPLYRESATLRSPSDRIGVSILRAQAAPRARGTMWIGSQDPGQTAVGDLPAPPPGAAPAESPAQPRTDPIMDPAEPTASTDIFTPRQAGFPGESCGGCNNCQAGQMYCWIDTLSLGLGVEGFTGPLNRGQDGSFGFQQGVNWGSPVVFTPLCMNTQIGFRAVQSNFEGASFTDSTRQQFFLTAGFFRRAECGWQGGIVYDYLHDDWDRELDLGQLRGEVSWAVPNGSSFGVRFASSLSTEEVLQGTESWGTHDWYTAFYEHRLPRFRGGLWRVFAGWSGESDGLVGTDFKVPLGGAWSLEPTFTYLIPDEDSGAGRANEAEAWNVAFNLVWYPSRCVGEIDYRRLPLFDVAGNGSMIAKRK